MRFHACRMRHVPLVCRRFAEACRDPSAWPELHIPEPAWVEEQRWQGFLRWLPARAPGLQTLVSDRDWVRPFPSVACELHWLLALALFCCPSLI